MTVESLHLIRIPGSPNGEPTAFTAEEMEQILQQQLEEQGDGAKNTRWALVYLYSRTGRQKEALEQAKQLLELTDEPEEGAFVFLSLGQLMEQLDDYRSAATYYKAAFRMEPAKNRTWYFIHNNLGYCLNQLSKYEEAEQYLKAAIKINPRPANAYKNLGLSYQGQTRYAEAAECFVLATEVNAADRRSLGHLEQLIQERPELLEEVADLADDLNSCRKAVQMAESEKSAVIRHPKSTHPVVRLMH